jgi:hypothetical protein
VDILEVDVCTEEMDVCDVTRCRCMEKLYAGGREKVECGLLDAGWDSDCDRVSVSDSIRGAYDSVLE